MKYTLCYLIVMLSLAMLGAIPSATVTTAVNTNPPKRIVCISKFYKCPEINNDDTSNKKYCYYFLNGTLYRVVAGNNELSIESYVAGVKKSSAAIPTTGWLAPRNICYDGQDTLYLSCYYYPYLTIYLYDTKRCNIELVYSATHKYPFNGIYYAQYKRKLFIWGFRLWCVEDGSLKEYLTNDTPGRDFAYGGPPVVNEDGLYRSFKGVLLYRGFSEEREKEISRSTIAESICYLRANASICLYTTESVEPKSDESYKHRINLVSNHNGTIHLFKYPDTFARNVHFTDTLQHSSILRWPNSKIVYPVLCSTTGFSNLLVSGEIFASQPCDGWSPNSICSIAKGGYYVISYAH